MTMTRVRILCEDERSERFLRGLCDRQGIRVLEVINAPRGKGAASSWVSARYPEAMKQRRSRNFQQGLGLLVHVDGDNLGPQSRRRQLDDALRAVQVSVRTANEPVAIFVPTWCIETWLLHLSGIATPPETAKLKRDPDPTWRPALHQLEKQEALAIRQAVAAWSTADATQLPSLADARTEGLRLGWS